MSDTKLVFILIGARRRVGKDTFAGCLLNEIKKSDFPSVPKSFAGALKDDVNHILSCTGGWPGGLDAWTQDATEKENVIRPLLIAYGNARRHYNENHWVDRVIADAERMRDSYVSSFRNREEMPKPYYFVVVSDWRFPNEIERIREKADHVFGIHLSRSTAPEGTPDEIVNDPLCCELADIFVANEGDLDALQGTADAAFRNMIQNKLYFQSK